ncbi:hypothetical protein MA5S0921_0174 [Mycobacteroides abscessus 5S-0921]|uniref:Uncharacterized protein n=1 Tax=Mycobacteroides abscessus subsp. bolletii 1513 TaxID=1299321 RepID=X8E1N5_9MYCO|nr:hypothetical protein MA5S0421_4907 [Mycobacteroides abscessus 5S-0421]EIU21908.1 hypothetical protein MA5S0708_4599 [Mycobacteroides abscessus 5S-0708]EIU25912.1 hypothetical protein MA5S0817_4223 [Mycobacteroides abscessus 5S-0817]EIU30650.1 hypothetical protein MA5S1212_1747 [Mycobacteroides abscessus 5S-1212]EIU44419.1 hypothetical protein MA5S1215_4626 [Mycobacteroides abscessus 5S-1215]EIV01479.1 hypothetical protein MA5S0921_0174 [Mycobacteroides abscessus 5S-0921]EUA74161.1 hypothet
MLCQNEVQATTLLKVIRWAAQDRAEKRTDVFGVVKLPGKHVGK